jgi:N-acetylneuraminate synthase/N,N'-diacetyllegionaminate synthase
LPVGLSDHTTSILTCLLSVLKKTNLIEKHFTLNKFMEGPDHILSANLDEFSKICLLAKKFKINKKNESFFKIIKKYKIENLINKKITKNFVNKIMGDGIKKILPSEYETINSQRKSLYAKINIKKGHFLTKENIIIKGPGGGLLPKYFDVILGKKAKKNIDADYPITWEVF